MRRSRPLWQVFLPATLAFFVAAGCGSGPGGERAASPQIIRTKAGDATVVNVLRTKSLAGGYYHAPAGSTILVVYLRPQVRSQRQSLINLLGHSAASGKGKIYVVDSAGKRANIELGGLLEGRLLMAFVTPQTERTFKLFMPGEPSLTLTAK